MQSKSLGPEGLIEIIPRLHEDSRGYFCEVFRKDVFAEIAPNIEFVQENQSLSRVPGTIRGLHFQTEPFAQGKLVRCITGSVFDVAVDLRMGSPYYGRPFSLVLTAERANQLWLPAGFAHGFCTLEPDTTLCYKVSAPYSPEHDKGLAWNDPQIGIEWPSLANPKTLSAKDRVQPLLADLPTLFTI